MDELIDRPVLAIDLGGTQIRAALITPDQQVRVRRAVPTRDEEGVEMVIARICDAAAGVRADASAAGLPPPVGVGISAPGPLDPWRGVIVAPPNLSGWHDVPLASQVGGALDLPVFLERDTNVALAAEWRYGAATGANNAVYITVSTGVGGAAVIDGRPLIGADGMAGEMGHLMVDLDGPPCGCGGAGHVEAIASGTAIARDAQALLATGTSPRLARLVAAGEVVDAELVARASDDGDPACAAIMARARAAIGALCSSLVNLLNPDVIVIGGSIAEHRPRFFDEVHAALDRHSFDVPASRVRVELARLGGDVSLIGCLPIVNARISDPAFAGPSSGSATAAPHTAARKQEGAVRS